MENNSWKMNKAEQSELPVPLWLITFTDVMALMLTFFVLLYAMSVPQEDKWEDISTALSGKLSAFTAKPFSAGSQDVVSIDRIGKSSALDLTYLETLVLRLLKDKGVENVILMQNDRRLIISLPSELLFEAGNAEIGGEGKKLLFILAGVLQQVKNRVEISGNTDPRPISGGQGTYKTNWELSLARAASVANILRDVGYMRLVTIRGVSSARYDELPEGLPENRAYDLSRRVDIILMNDDGYRLNAFDSGQ